MCQKTKLLVEESDGTFKEVNFAHEKANTATILVELFNALVVLLTPKPKDSISSVARWLKLIGLEKYRENFESCGLDRLLTLKVGLSEKDFEELKITNLGDKKLIQFSLLNLKIEQVPFLYSYIPITMDEFGEHVSLQDPLTLRNFLSKRFLKFQPLLQVLNCFHQATVVSFLGHLGESLFYTSGYRFKDIKG
jgi:hypothetical protein